MPGFIFSSTAHFVQKKKTQNKPSSAKVRPIVVNSERYVLVFDPAKS